MSAATRSKPRARPAVAEASVLRRRERQVVGAVQQSRGSTLPDGLRAELEPRLGHDLSRVRIHADDAAARAAALLGANAFATGAHVYFGAGRFHPDDRAGRLLLIHELAHTVQQGMGPVVGGGAALVLTRPDEDVEVRADRAAAEVAEGHTLRPGALGPDLPAARGRVARLAIVGFALESLLEVLDPARALDGMAVEIAQMIDSDPDDRAGRVRGRLERLQPERRVAVMERVEARVTSSRWAALQRVLRERPSPGITVDTPSVPAVDTRQRPDTRPETTAPGEGGPTGATVLGGEHQKPAVRPGETEAAPQPPGQRAQAQEAEPPAAGTAAAAGADGATAGEAAPRVPDVDAAAAEAQAAATATQGAAGAAPAQEGERRAPAGGSEGPPAAGGGGAENADVAAAERAGLPSDSEAGAPADAAPRAASGVPAPATPARAAEAIPQVEGGTALPASDTAAAAELEVEAEAGEREHAATPDGGGAAEEAGPRAAPSSGAGGAGAPADVAEPGVPTTVAREAATLAPPPPSATGATMEEPSVPSSGDGAMTDAGGAGGSEAAGEAGPAAGPEPQEAAPGPAPASGAPSEAGPAAEADHAAALPEAEVAEAPSAESVGTMTTPPAGTDAGTAVAAAPGGAPAVTTEPATAAAEVAGGAGAQLVPAGPATAPPADAPAPGVDAGPAADAAVAPGPQDGAASPEAPGAAEAGPQQGGAGAEPAAGAEAAPAAEGGDADAGGGGGQCGGGGAEATAEPQPEAAPAPLAGADPVQAMDGVAAAPPGQMEGALGGVAQASDHALQTQQTELAKSPPQMERPSGVSADLDGKPPPPPPAATPSAAPDQVARVPAGAATHVPAPAPPPAPPPSPVQAARPPAVPGESKVDEQTARQVQAAVHAVPVTDPALAVTAGEAPHVALNGDADPEQAQRQRSELDRSASAAHEKGQRDAAEPMGEDHVHPQVPPETLRGDPAAGGAAGGAPGLGGAPAANGAVAAAGAAPAAGGTGDAAQAASIVAQDQRGDALRASVAQARGQMVSGQQEHANKVTDARTDSQKQVDGGVKDSARDQATARTDVQREVQGHRTQWNREQTDLTDHARADAEVAGRTGEEKITRQREDADSKASRHYGDANTEIAGERQRAEGKAADRRREAEEKSSTGVLGWIGSGVTAFFEGLRSAITTIFDAARKVVRAAIDRAQKLAAEVIDLARRAIVTAIQVVGKALVAIGDVLLAAFPGLRDRFRKLIKDAVDLATRIVNEIANRLKQHVQDLLNLLARGLDLLLRALKAAYLAAVDVVRSAVKSALDFARSVVQGFAAFVALIKDVAADPLGWLGKLGRAAVDGVKNCLWKAFKRAIKQWFNDKVQEVLGLGLLIWRLLKSGGINLAQVARMAWEGLKAAIPGVLIQLLIEKLIALIVPAAGALMTIIEGLKAAWGSISRILAAFEKFFHFLKSVKSGRGAGPFAEAVAAAAIAVIEFVANWLLARLRKPAGAISGRLSGLAQKFQRVGGAVRSGAGAVVRSVRTAAHVAVTGVRAGARYVARAAQAVGRGIVRGVRAIGRVIGRSRIGKALGRGLKRVGKFVAHSRLGRAVTRLYQGARRRVQNLRQRFRDWKERRRRNREERQRERLGRALTTIRPGLQQLLDQGVSRAFLWVRLQAWRVRYLLSGLSLQSTGDIVARINPRGTAARTERLAAEQIGAALEVILARAERRFFARRREGRTQQERTDIREAERMLRQGEEGNLPLRWRADQIEVMRRIARRMPGRQPIAPGRASLDFSAREQVTVLDRRYLSRFFAQRTPGGSKYHLIASSMRRLVRDHGIDENQVLRALNARTTRGAALRTANIARAIKHPEDRQTFKQLMASTGVLTQSVEAARGPGYAIAQPLAMEVTGTLYQVLYPGGRFALITPPGAAGQLEDEYRGRPSRSPERAATQATRRVRLANIFRRLARLVERRDMRTRSGSVGKALSNLGHAFERWAAAREDLIIDVAEGVKAEAELEAALLAYVETIHGG